MKLLVKADKVNGRSLSLVKLVRHKELNRTNLWYVRIFTLDPWRDCVKLREILYKHNPSLFSFSPFPFSDETH